MNALSFHQFPCLDDNYGVLVHDEATGATATIDVPDAAAVLGALEEKGWTLSHILVTHHHWDHTQGVGEVKQKTNATVIGPSGSDIEHLEKTVGDGDNFHFAHETVHVITTPGHTLDMINFHFPKAGVAFTGDTLFSLGCGRIFEGNPAMMWESMEKLLKLPSKTRIYCGHEYTLANAKFALSVDPENTALQHRAKEVERLREAGEPTVPTTMELELATNPFLRPDNAHIRNHLAMVDASDAEVFAEIRKRKDNF